MVGADIGHGYQPLKIAMLAELLRGKDDGARWRLVAEFLEEYPVGAS